MLLLLATANVHKVRELQSLLADVPGLQLVSLRDYPEIEMPPEDGSTMRDNARIKALHCARASGLPALADDSGIEVDALDGRPGVHSARWLEGSDQDRMRALLKAVRESGSPNRAARYRCAISLAVPQPGGEIVCHETESSCEGLIGDEPRGQNGFGYDPIFTITPQTGAPQEWIGRTMAEVPNKVKAQVSHRARAIGLMKEVMLKIHQ